MAVETSTDTGQTNREDLETICGGTCDDGCERVFAKIRARLDSARTVARTYITECRWSGAPDPLTEDLVCVSVGVDHPAAYALNELFLIEIIFGSGGAIAVDPPRDGSVVAFVSRERIAQMIPMPSKIAAILSTRGRSTASMPMIGADGPHAILATYVHAAHTLH